MVDADEDWLVDDEPAQNTEPQPPWYVLVVDDEPDIHQVTRLALQHIDFLGRPLEILSCYSGAEALVLLRQRHDIALILLDVVMETDDAGLVLARKIREELRNHCVRIILRTGQPGVAPERQVIESYDINDYKAKTELTRDRLFTSVLGSLRSYNDINTIEQQRSMLEANQRGLYKVIEASSSILRMHSIHQFAEGVLEQLQALLFFEKNALYVVVQGGLTALSSPDGALRVIHSTQGYQHLCGKSLDRQELERFRAAIDQAIAQETSVYAEDHFVGFFKSRHGPVNLLIIDGPVAKSHPDTVLVELFCRNVSVAYENLLLFNEMEETQRSIIYQLSEAIELRSAEAGNHIRRMAQYCWLLAKEMDWSDEDAGVLRDACPMHDAGKVAIPDSILNKPGPLTEAERAVINQHAEIGYEIFRHARARILKMAATIAYEHHERWDGKGYPRGIARQKISPAGRIVSLADVYDALSHARCYKEAWPQDRVCEAIRAGSGTQFDPDVVDAFFRIYPQINAVRLGATDVAAGSSHHASTCLLGKHG